MTILSYSKTVFNTECLAMVITMLTEFDDLPIFKKMCMIIHLCTKLDSLAKTYFIQERANTVLSG